MLTLSELLRPIDARAFTQEYYARNVLHVRGAREKYASLFSWASLNEVLNSNLIPHPTVKLTREGQSTSPRDSFDIIHQVRSGSTLIVEELDQFDASAASLLNNLSAELRAPTRINLYLSPAGHRGYRKHYDTHDVFILQVEGSKRWRVFPPTIKAPLFHQKYHGTDAPEEELAYFDEVISAGDLLYVPKGHWHYALAESEPSLHLTLAMFFRTGIDFLSWLVDELREDPRVRDALPLDIRGLWDGTAMPQWNARVDELRNIVDDRLGSDGIASRYYEFVVANQKNRRPFGFPRHFSDLLEEDLRGCRLFAVPRSWQIRKEDAAENMQLVCAGRLLTLPASSEPAIRVLFSRDGISYDELISGVRSSDTRAVKEALRALLVEGIVALERAEQNLQSGAQEPLRTLPRHQASE